MNKLWIFWGAFWILYFIFNIHNAHAKEQSNGWPNYDHSQNEAVERDCEAKEWFEDCLKTCGKDDRCIDRVCTSVEFNEKHRDWNCLKRHSLDWIDDKSYLQKFD